MNNLLSLTNAADKAAISQTNFQTIDASLAFGAYPSIDPATGIAVTYLGAPATGTYVVGQFWVDASLGVWRCTVGGTPGTWIQVQPAICSGASPGAPLNNYWILRTDLLFTQYYWTGAAWQAVFTSPP
jgi:hypothetical protein